MKSFTPSGIISEIIGGGGGLLSGFGGGIGGGLF
jgi:hypothetical protein